METQNQSAPILPAEALRRIVKEEIDRRLRQLAFEAKASGTDAKVARAGGAANAEPADEVGEAAVAYDAGSPGDLLPAVLDLSSLVEAFKAPSSSTAPTGFADDDGRELPSTLPEVAEDCLTASEAAERLGVNSSRVRQRLGDQTLYGFKYQGAWRLPVWQFEGAATVPNLDRVVPALRPEESPVGVTRWFISPWEDLLTEEGELLSPRRWLLEGRDPAPVIAQAGMA